MPIQWNEIAPGILNDAAIKGLGRNGGLITSGFQEQSVQECCYEFHIGDQYIDLSRGEADRLKALRPGEVLIIRPRSSVVVKLAETIQIPNDCMARFLLKGKFFSVGLSPVNTYADPGFGIAMGIVLTNVSNGYIKLPRGEAIVKAEFEKLPVPVERPYQGQHGFTTDHWPVLAQYKAGPDDLAAAGISSSSLEQIEFIHGVEIRRLVGQLRYFSSIIAVQVALVFLFFAIILAFEKKLGVFVSLCLGVLANFATSLAFYGWGRLKRRF